MERDYNFPLPNESEGGREQRRDNADAPEHGGEFPVPMAVENQKREEPPRPEHHAEPEEVAPRETNETKEPVPKTADVGSNDVEPTPAAGTPEQESPHRISVRFDDEQYQLEYVSKESIFPAFGYAGEGTARVREDLPPRVKQFVTEHELYHLRDRATWGGWIGREVRANIAVGLKDPLGFLATAHASLNRERLSFYWQRLKRGF